MEQIQYFLKTAIHQYSIQNYEAALKVVNQAHRLLEGFAPGNPLSLEFDVIYILSSVEEKRDSEKTILIFLRITNSFGALAIQTLLKYCHVR